MSVFDKLVNRGRKHDPFSGGSPAPPLPAGDDPSQSFLSMNDDVENAAIRDEVGSPIMPCQEPWLELTLRGADGRPAAKQPFLLSVPGASGISGILDESGYVRVEGVNVNAADCSIRVEVEEDDESEIVKYKIEVVPRETAAEEKEEEITGEPSGEPYTVVDFDPEFPDLASFPAVEGENDAGEDEIEE